ncbi:MAG: hypothetical protein P8J50_00455 [Acidimicrobiales bacterium]|jgi:hypothetical protein|nr:hypothetical protein [Acidimicrobiales bacterium]
MQPVPLSKGKRRARSAIKRFLYAQLLIKDAFMVAIGRGKPLVRFTVENDPPSAYLNFAIRPDQVAAFEDYIAVPMPLAPMACIAGDEPYFCLTLNMYRVSGLAFGIRAEWSTYVLDDDGIPRYMVVEAECEKGTLDSVDLFTVKGLAEYEVLADGIRLRCGGERGTECRAQLPLPPTDAPVHADPMWVTANDFIYWRNGVCDRTFYDAGLANPRMQAIDPATVAIDDLGHWTPFLDPLPRSVVAFQDPITFAMSPWWNIDEL